MAAHNETMAAHNGTVATNNGTMAAHNGTAAAHSWQKGTVAGQPPMTAPWLATTLLPITVHSGINGT